MIFWVFFFKLRDVLYIYSYSCSFYGQQAFLVRVHVKRITCVSNILPIKRITKGQTFLIIYKKFHRCIYQSIWLIVLHKLANIQFYASSCLCFYFWASLPGFLPSFLTRDPSYRESRETEDVRKCERDRNFISATLRLGPHPSS